MRWKISRFDSVDSTNAKGKDSEVGSVIVASEQTGGKGRLGRSWSSLEGGAWFSIVLGNEVKNVQQITFLASVSVVRAVKNLCGLDAGIKWSNDVYVDGKKLCGILSEGVFGVGDKVVVGVGINVNNEIPSDLSDIAVSLKELGYNVDKDKLIDAVLDVFGDYYEKLVSDGGSFSDILDEWKKNCIHMNKKVKIKGKDGEKAGVCVDVDHECRLVLDDGTKVVEGDLVLS